MTTCVDYNYTLSLKIFMINYQITYKSAVVDVQNQPFY